MISAATGAVALVIAPLVREHGLDYLVATVILAGIIQVVLGVLGVARLMRFIPRSCDGRLRQRPGHPDLPGAGARTWSVCRGSSTRSSRSASLIMVVLPRLTKAVPAPLVAIVALTAVTVLAAVAVPTVGDEGKLPDSLPTLFLPSVPLSLHTLSIGPYALAMALVGLMESLMTAKLVDDVTDTHSNKTREAWGQGAANIVTGFFGGMGGCAMIGQTMINVKASGARTRISTFLAGVFLLILVVGLGDVVALIPMAALVAVMIMVSVATFDWHSIQPRTLRRMPKSETLVMVATVIVAVATHNLAIGVVVGVLVAMVLFARRVAHFTQVDRDFVTTPTATPASTPSPASCSSPPATTSPPSSTTPATPTTSSSTCPAPTSGTPPPSPPSMRSPTKYAAQGQDRRHRRPQRRQRRAPRTPRRPLRRRSLTLSTRWGLLPTRWVPPARPQSPE